MFIFRQEDGAVEERGVALTQTVETPRLKLAIETKTVFLYQILYIFISAVKLGMVTWGSVGTE